MKQNRLHYIKICTDSGEEYIDLMGMRTNDTIKLIINDGDIKLVEKTVWINNNK